MGCPDRVGQTIRRAAVEERAAVASLGNGTIDCSVTAGSGATPRLNLVPH